MTSADRSPDAPNAADARNVATPAEPTRRASDNTEGELRRAVEELVASVESLLEKSGGTEPSPVRRDLDRVRSLLGSPSGETARDAGSPPVAKGAVPAARSVGTDEDIQKDLQRAML